MTLLEHAIIKTLAYFDLFGRPLTSGEIYQWLWKNHSSYSEVEDALVALVEKNILSCLEQQYVLAGREHLVPARQLAIPRIDTKMRIAARAATRLRWIPFFEALFVCNTVASASALEDSDIDVFIVIRRGRIWITRFLISLTLSLFFMRRNKAHVANKICLSFYVTDEHLNLSDVTIGAPDIYMMYWIDQLIPIYDPKHLRQALMNANKWIQAYVPHATQSFEMNPRWRVTDGTVATRIKHFFERVWGSAYGDLIESQAKHMQQKKMSWNVSSKKDAPDTHVIVDDTMLKFHEHDRRENYRDQWLAQVSQLIVD